MGGGELASEGAGSVTGEHGLGGLAAAAEEDVGELQAMGGSEALELLVRARGAEGEVRFERTLEGCGHARSIASGDEGQGVQAVRVWRGGFSHT